MTRLTSRPSPRSPRPLAALAAAIATALVAGLLSGTASASPTAQLDPETPEQPAPEQPTSADPPVDATDTGLVVVELDPDAAPAERDEALADAGLELVPDQPAAGTHVLTRPTAGPTSASAVAERVEDGDVIVGAEPVLSAVPDEAAPDDEFYPRQWNLDLIQTRHAWAFGTGAGATVAVVDGGIARGAPDLAGTTFVEGYDFVDNDSDPFSFDGHATHVASIIAQTTGNLTGGASIAPDAAIMPLRIFTDDARGYDIGVASAIRWAVDHGAHIVNLSLSFERSSQVMLDAIAYAVANDVTLVASAGNRDGDVRFPASHPDVIAVAATGALGERASYSNRGPEVTVAAPGGHAPYDTNGDGITDLIYAQSLKTDGTPSYCNCGMQGTSMAAPHVAAVAALIVSAGVSDRDAIREAITATAADVGPRGFDEESGHGLVQARDAVVHARVQAGLMDSPPASLPDPQLLDQACPITAATASASEFSDVRAGTHARAIACVTRLGIADGGSTGKYHPTSPVTRGQMATFLARVLRAAGVPLLAAPSDAFPDDNGNRHELAINQLAAAGIVQGGADGRYDPNSTVTRAAMASFLARTYDLAAANPLPEGSGKFTDLGGTTHAAAINRVAAARLALGTGNDLYAPSDTVSRAQMATFLARTVDRLISAATTGA